MQNPTTSRRSLWNKHGRGEEGAGARVESGRDVAPEIPHGEGDNFTQRSAASVAAILGGGPGGPSFGTLPVPMHRRIQLHKNLIDIYVGDKLAQIQPVVFDAHGMPSVVRWTVSDLDESDAYEVRIAERGGIRPRFWLPSNVASALRGEFRFACSVAGTPASSASYVRHIGPNEFAFSPARGRVISRGSHTATMLNTVKLRGGIVAKVYTTAWSGSGSVEMVVRLLHASRQTDGGEIERYAVGADSVSVSIIAPDGLALAPQFPSPIAWRGVRDVAQFPSPIAPDGLALAPQFPSPIAWRGVRYVAIIDGATGTVMPPGAQIIRRFTLIHGHDESSNLPTFCAVQPDTVDVLDNEDQNQSASWTWTATNAYFAQGFRLPIGSVQTNVGADLARFSSVLSSGFADAYPITTDEAGGVHPYGPKYGGGTGGEGIYFTDWFDSHVGYKLACLKQRMKADRQCDLYVDDDGNPITSAGMDSEIAIELSGGEKGDDDGAYRSMPDGQKFKSYDRQHDRRFTNECAQLAWLTGDAASIDMLIEHAFSGTLWTNGHPHGRLARLQEHTTTDPATGAQMGREDGWLWDTVATAAQLLRPGDDRRDVLADFARNAVEVVGNAMTSTCTWSAKANKIFKNEHRACQAYEVRIGEHGLRGLARAFATDTDLVNACHDTIFKTMLAMTDPDGPWWLDGEVDSKGRERFGIISQAAVASWDGETAYDPQPTEATGPTPDGSTSPRFPDYNVGTETFQGGNSFAFAMRIAIARRDRQAYAQLYEAAQTIYGVGFRQVHPKNGAELIQFAQAIEAGHIEGPGQGTE